MTDRMTKSHRGADAELFPWQLVNDYPPVMINMGMDQYLLIPFLGG